MSRLDQIISEVNGDLQDVLSITRDRFRKAMECIFDYCVANPSQGNAATAQTGIANAFKATYSDGLVAPGITIESAVAVFNQRHGVGANANAKWVSVRDFIVERTTMQPRILKWIEEGTLPPIEELWLNHLIGDLSNGFPRVSDLVATEITNTPTLQVTEYSSASLGKTVRHTTSRTNLGGGNESVEYTVEIL